MEHFIEVQPGFVCKLVGDNMYQCSNSSFHIHADQHGKAVKLDTLIHYDLAEQGALAQVKRNIQERRSKNGYEVGEIATMDLSDMSPTIDVKAHQLFTWHIDTYALLNRYASEIKEKLHTEVIYKP